MLKLVRCFWVCAVVAGAVTAPTQGAENTRIDNIADPHAELQRLGRLFGEGTYLQKSAHYLVIYDTPHPWAQSRVSLLEDIVQTFYREMRIAGFDPKPLPVRQVAVLFNDHARFLKYAGTVDHKDASGAGGYYSARTNRIVFFNNQSNPQLNGLSDQIAQTKAFIDQADRAIAQSLVAGDANRAQHNRSQKQRALMQLGILQNRHSSASGRGNVIQTLHEAAHQLAYHSGVMKRGRVYPFWISEGIATNFETTHPATSHGPRQDNALRRNALIAVRRKGAMLPLSQLTLTITPPGTADTQGDWYAQSWGLFHFLFNKNPSQLRQFMRQWGESPGIEKNTAQASALFEKTFGNLQRMESEWRAYVRNL